MYSLAVKGNSLLPLLPFTHYLSLSLSSHSPLSSLPPPHSVPLFTPSLPLPIPYTPSSLPPLPPFTPFFLPLLLPLASTPSLHFLPFSNPCLHPSSTPFLPPSLLLSTQLTLAGEWNDMVRKIRSKCLIPFMLEGAPSKLAIWQECIYL